MNSISHRYHHFRKLYTSIICIVFIAFFFVGQAGAQTLNKHGISIMIPRNSSQYQQVVRSIQDKLKKNGVNDPVNIISLSDFRQLQSINLDNKKKIRFKL